MRCIPAGKVTSAVTSARQRIGRGARVAGGLSTVFGMNLKEMTELDRSRRMTG